MQQKIKVIVFDFDDTLYTSENVWGNLYSYTINILEKFLSIDESKRILEESILMSKGKINFNMITSVLQQNGYDAKKFVKNIAQTIYMHTGKVEVIPNEFLQELSKKYTLYCVSMSDKTYLNYYFDKYKINKTCFKEILSANIVAKDKTKVPVLKKIIKKEGIFPSELLMVGDSFSPDIMPAIKVGAETFHFNQKNFNQIYDYFTENGILDCEKFKK